MKEYGTALISRFTQAPCPLPGRGGRPAPTPKIMSAWSSWDVAAMLPPWKGKQL